MNPAGAPPVPRGRFAPSPSGPLHFGSLVAAVGSFADARAQGGEWLLRIEDLDPPRTVPGAADDILRTLEAFGLLWDGPVWYQSGRGDAYAAALARLRADGQTFACACSRREVAERGAAGPEGPLYPGTCRDGLPAGRLSRSERLRVGERVVGFTDRVHGPIRQRLATAVGDYVLRRADGCYAYQLAVVVDDSAQGITQVVRGADLLASTPRQLDLQRLLGLPHPAYAHLPLVLGPDGHKLSKSLAARPVDAANPLPGLLAAWAVLGQAPLAPVTGGATDRATGRPFGDVAGFWAQALAAWQMGRVPRAPVAPR